MVTMRFSSRARSWAGWTSASLSVSSSRMVTMRFISRGSLAGWVDLDSLHGTPPYPFLFSFARGDEYVYPPVDANGRPTKTLHTYGPKWGALVAYGYETVYFPPKSLADYFERNIFFIGVAVIAAFWLVASRRSS